MTDRPKLGYLSVGRYVPKHVLTNAHLEQMVDTTDEWIVQRTGIRTRHIMGPDESIPQMATSAARTAIADSGIDPAKVSILQIGVNSHMRFPSLASIVEMNLGLSDITAADVSAGCSAFIFAVEAVCNHILTNWVMRGELTYGVAIGVDGLSSIVDYTDRSTCVLFGDGAGAVVIGPVEAGEILSIHTRTMGRHTDLLYLDEFLSHSLQNTADMQMVARNGTTYPFLRMEGRKVFPVAVRSMMADIRAVVDKCNHSGNDPVSLSNIEFVIPHQANLRIVTAVQEGLKLREDQVYRDGVINYGNTSAASIPLAYVDEWDKRPGALEVDVAFGAGFASGAILRRMRK